MHLIRDEINACATKFDVPVEPLNTSLTQSNRINCLNYPLEWGRVQREETSLIYGQRLEVIQTISPNRAGCLYAGDIVIFLGHYSFPYDNGLRLYFEDSQARKIALEFEGNIPSKDYMQMWKPELFPEHFRQLPDNERSKTLRTVGSVIRSLVGTVSRKDPHTVYDDGFKEGYKTALESLQSSFSISAEWLEAGHLPVDQGRGN